MGIRFERGVAPIELLLVAAIAAVMVAIAATAWQTDIRRTRTAEVVAASMRCRTTALQYFATRGAERQARPLPRCDVGLSEWIDSGIVATSGAIIVRSRVPGAEGFIQLTPLGADGLLAKLDDGPIRVSGWRCGPAIDWPGVDVRFLPESCRGS